MPWAVFTTRTQWATFHDAVCADLGIPKPGRRQSDQTPQVDKQWTDAAFAPTVVTLNINGTDRKVAVCQVPQKAVTRYNLNTVTDPTRNRDEDGFPTGTWTVTYQGTQHTVAPAEDETAFPFRKAKPTTITIDGKTYTRSK